MDKSMNNIHVFHTVVLVLKQMNEDVEKYIETSASEGHRDIRVRNGVSPRIREFIEDTK